MRNIPTKRNGIDKRFADGGNKASTNVFVTNIAPCYYFIKDGSIIKKVDLSTIPDKKSIIEEVDKYLKQ
jgi:hypothetical protein